MPLRAHTQKECNLFPVESGYIPVTAGTWQIGHAMQILLLKVRGIHVSLLTIASVMIIRLTTAWELVTAIILTIITWRNLLGQWINGKESEIGTWDWMTDWNVHPKPRMRGNVKVTAISLDCEGWPREDFDTKRCCAEFLRKARCWQTDGSGIQG